MCGIAGAIGLPEAEGRATVTRMLRTLVHRGPDAEGIVAGPGWALGARRLAIVDLETGNQPVANESGTVHAVLNGEIYNYLELRRALAERGHRLASRGDTEVLVHLWEERAGGMLGSLRGMFALAVLDEAAGTLLLARDRVGKKPLYVWPRGGTLLFASELKALWAAAGHGPEVDEDALDAFLAWGFVPEGLCIARGVSRLAPAHALAVDLAGGTRRLFRYAACDPCPQPEMTFAEAVAVVRETLPEAVRLRTRADVPVAVFLSGGLDSGCVAALAADSLTGRALCVTFPGHASELPLARQTARRWGLDLEEVEVAAEDGIGLLDELAEIYDEPLADPSVVPTVLVARAARRFAKVVLNGDGGDETLGGYRRWLVARAREVAGGWAPLLGSALAPAARVLGGRLHRFREGLVHPCLYAAVGPAKLSPAEVAVLRGRVPPLPAALVEAMADGGLGEVERVRRLDLGFFLPGDLLPKMDRATMAASVEARSPFLDHVVLERLGRVPAAVLLRGGRTKAVLREAAREWLPPRVRRAPKRGFEVPLAAWLRGPWQGVVREALEDPRAALRRHVDGSALAGWAGWFRRADRQRAARCVFTLLTLERWLRRWA